MFFSFLYLAVRALLGLLVRNRHGVMCRHARMRATPAVLLRGGYVIGAGHLTPEPLLTMRQLWAVTLLSVRARTRLRTSLAT
jgi:hypothetical protein